MSESKPVLWAVVPAAGSGSRFSASGAKQYVMIGDQTVLERSVSALLGQSGLKKIVVAVHPDDKQAEMLPRLQNEKISFVHGGADRAESVLHALMFLLDFADPNDWVLVHDAARPCLSVVDLNNLVATLTDDLVGGILAVPAIDTLKKADDAERIVATVDRSSIWHAQTPQMFRYGLLLDCLKKCRESLIPVTDEASAVEAFSHQVRLVRGSRSNIKITFPEDIALATFYLQQEDAL